MANQQAPHSGTSQNDQFKAHYQSYIDFCNARDYEAVEKFYTSPIYINDEPRPSFEVIEGFKPLVEAFPDWRWEIRRFIIDGEYVTVHFNLTGTHQGTFQGIEATGRRIKTTELTLYRVVDGQFSHVWPFLDLDSIIKQIS